MDVSFPPKEILKWSQHSELTVMAINFVKYSEAIYRDVQMKSGGMSLQKILNLQKFVFAILKHKIITYN